MQIMVAGDDESARLELRQFLLSSGDTARTVNTFGLDQALPRFEQLRPDVLLLWLSPMPECGLAVLQDLCPSPANVVAIGPVSDPKLILRTLRAGATHYVEESDWRSELPAALSRIHSPTETETLSTQGRLIALLGPSGGSGASTLAVNIASALTRENQSCGLVDMKLNSGDLASLLDLSPANTLVDYCANLNRMDRVMFQNCFARHTNGVHLLSAPATHDDVAQVTDSGVRSALSMTRAMFPYVIVDVDHSYDSRQAEVLTVADVVLIVIRLEFTALRQAKKALDYMTSLGVPGERMRLVVNRFHRQKQLRISDIERSLNMKIAEFIPNDPQTVSRANNKGVPVIEERPRAKISRSIVKLAASVNGAGSQIA